MDISHVYEVPLADIKLQGSNVRSDLDSQNSQDSLSELADNIQVNGLLQPIVLRGKFGHPPYDVIVGQRRFLAHKLLNKATIQATFSGIITDIDALLFSLSENMCRQEMNNEDMARAVTILYNHYGKNEYEVQRHTGFSIRTIRALVKIEEQASPKLKEYLSKGLINLTDARRVIEVAQGDYEKADALIEEMPKLSKYEKKRLIESANRIPKADVNQLLEDARKPKLEETIILNLPRKIHNALLKASEALSLDIEELTINTVTHWLRINDFLID